MVLREIRIHRQRLRRRQRHKQLVLDPRRQVPLVLDPLQPIGLQPRVLPLQRRNRPPQRRRHPALRYVQPRLFGPRFLLRRQPAARRIAPVCVLLAPPRLRRRLPVTGCCRIALVLRLDRRRLRTLVDPRRPPQVRSRFLGCRSRRRFSAASFRRRSTLVARIRFSRAVRRLCGPRPFRLVHGPHALQTRLRPAPHTAPPRRRTPALRSRCSAGRSGRASPRPAGLCLNCGLGSALLGRRALPAPRRRRPLRRVRDRRGTPVRLRRRNLRAACTAGYHRRQRHRQNCGPAHQGVCGQSRAIPVYFDSLSPPSAFMDAVLSDNSSRAPYPRATRREQGPLGP